MNHLTRGSKSFAAKTTGGLLLMMLACLPVSVFAHAKLIRSQPKAREALSQAPPLVELWFSEELEQGFNTIQVKDQQGKRVDRGEVTLSEENKKAAVTVDGLGAGTYTVAWKVLSMDEHTLRGTFTFTVTQGPAPAGTEASPSNAAGGTGAGQATPQVFTVESMPSAESGPGFEISPGQSAVRWLGYLAMMTLFGGFAFYLFVLAPALRQVGLVNGTNDASAATAHRIVMLSWVSVVMLAVTSFVALVFQAAAVFDKSVSQSLSPSLLSQVIANTGYGGHWLLETISVLVLAAILVILSNRIKQSPEKGHKAIWWAGLVASAVLLIAPSWTGHAVAAVKDYRLAIVTDWLHLLAGGFWVGGLFHLALTLPSAIGGFDRTPRVSLLSQVIWRFTRIAMPAVALLVLAGLYNTWVHVPSLSGFWLTPYGKTLLLKLLFVGIMLMLGGINNFHFGKRAALLSQMNSEGEDDAERGKLERSLARSVRLEATTGAIVLLITSALVFMMPARSHPAMTPVEHPVISSAGKGLASN